jgi:curved DNA-binding protein CbpA
MKDYYYILGIRPDASMQEIKIAYRKLSLKFHPDVNKGDSFFTERFKEIQEAYEVLIDETKRNNYNNNKSDTSEQNNNKANFIPYIEFFKTNVLYFEYDEEITFSWKSINSDKVFLKPFGFVQPIGQRIYKIKNFKDPSLTFELIAENSSIGKVAKSTLVLKNKTYQDLYDHFKMLITKENSQNSSNSYNHQSYDGKSKNSTIDFAEEMKKKGLKILGEIEVLDGRKLFFCVQFDTQVVGIIEGCKVFINGKVAINGIYKCKNSRSYEIENGLLKEEYLICTFKQSDGSVIEVESHRMRGISNGSRVWLNNYPAPNGMYQKGLFVRIHVTDGKIV